MSEQTPQEKWQVRLMGSHLPGLDKLSDLGLPDLSRLPWLNRPLLPAEVGDGLRDSLLARDNHLEDVNYQKIVPNHYIVEVSPTNFARNFRPIESQIIKQWTDRLLEELMTANSRRGRKEFRFGGRLRLEVRAGDRLKDNEARILSRIDPESGIGPRVSRPSAAATGGAPLASPRSQQPAPSSHPVAIQRPPVQVQKPSPAYRDPAPDTMPDPPRSGGTGPGPAGTISAAFLELVNGGQRWALYPGINTMGRNDTAQIYLDAPLIQEKRLVSGTHAYIVFEKGGCILYDGSPDGRPSANGTYVNLRRVPAAGYRLQNGDAVVLAAVDPLFPRSDTPGVATFYFWTQGR